MRFRISVSLCFVLSALAITRAEDVARVQANGVAEISFAARREHSDQFNSVQLDVIFVDPNGRELRVPGFWAGQQRWKVRYSSPMVGEHAYRTVYSDADEGLNDVRGVVRVEKYGGGNPLLVHGAVRVGSDHRHFEYADGTPFFWLGDTWWMGLCHRLKWPEELRELAEDRRAKGFNVVQIVAGLYPDMEQFDPRGANEAGFPWEKDYARIRPEYFDAADKRIADLVERGLSPCVVGAWGYYLSWMGVEKMEKHWRYLIARWGAYPVVWCAAGEANLPWYRAKGFPYDDRAQVKGWTEVMKYIRENDPYHRMLTIHPTGIGRLSARHATDDVGLLDFDMLQTPHGNREAVGPTISTVRESYNDRPVMPVIDGEAAYENLSGTIKTESTRRMFWICMMNGAAGHTYGANGIWQCNRDGQPHGASPWVGSPASGYGVTPWEEAMKYAGSAQVGYGRRFFEGFEWWKFTPHGEWAGYANRPVRLEGAQWIWSDEGKPGADSPAGRRYFRKYFDLPKDAVRSARVRVSADDQFVMTVNGKMAGHSEGAESWRQSRQFEGFGVQLHEGRNVIEVNAENVATPLVNGSAAPNPAGLIARMEIELENGKSIVIATDATWRVGKDVGRDELEWRKTAAIAKYGEGPWGKIDAGDDGTDLPMACGDEDVRVIYVPRDEAIQVRELKGGSSWQTVCFDPVKGDSREIGNLRADDAGRLKCDALGAGHDWVVALKRVEK